MSSRETPGISRREEHARETHEALLAAAPAAAQPVTLVPSSDAPLAAMVLAATGGRWPALLFDAKDQAATYVFANVDMFADAKRFKKAMKLA